MYLVRTLGILLTLVLGGVTAQDDKPMVAEELFESLLDSYHMMISPTAEKGEPTTISGMFSMLMIKSLDASQVFETTGTLVLEWTDARLTWNPDEHGGIRRLHMNPKTIWTPEIVLINGAEDLLQDFEKFQMTVSSDGLIHWEPSGSFKSSCQIDMTYYPSDTQECSLVFGTLTYSAQEVNLTTRTEHVNLDSYELSGEYELIRTNSRRVEFWFDCCPDETFSNLVFQVSMKRMNSYYIVNLILPVVLTSALLLTMFLSPPQYKVEIGLVVLISYRLLMLDVAHDIPKTSLHTPLLSVFLTVTMVIGTAGMAVAVFVLSLSHRGEKPVPGWVRRVTDTLGKVVCVRKDTRSTDEGSDGEKTAVMMENLSAASPGAAAGREGLKHGEEWRYVADVLDRCAFWILLIAMVISFCAFLVPVL